MTLYDRVMYRALAALIATLLLLIGGLWFHGTVLIRERQAVLREQLAQHEHALAQVLAAHPQYQSLADEFRIEDNAVRVMAPSNDQSPERQRVIDLARQCQQTGWLIIGVEEEGPLIALMNRYL